MDEIIQLAQKNTMEQYSTSIKQQAAIKKQEMIAMLTQEYQALEAILHCQQPGDDSDAVRRTMKQSTTLLSVNSIVIMPILDYTDLLSTYNNTEHYGMPDVSKEGPSEAEGLRMQVDNPGNGQ